MVCNVAIIYADERIATQQCRHEIPTLVSKNPSIPPKTHFLCKNYFYTSKGIIQLFILSLYLKRYKMQLSSFLKQQRKVHKLTQEELAAKAGVGLRLVREMEQGKTTMQMDKANQVLALFGAELTVTFKANVNG